MHTQLPAILRCIGCGTEGLQLGEVSQSGPTSEQIISGNVICRKCGAKYPIKDGILNFLPVRPTNIGIGQWTNHNRPVAWGYERFWRKQALTLMGGREWPPEEELATVIKMLEIDQPEKITRHNDIAFFLDAGCSTCFYGRAIAKAIVAGELQLGTADGLIVAVDNSWQMLQEARGFIAQDNLSDRISLVRADVEKLPFISKAFTGVACGGSLNEFQHTFAALNEMRRTLAPRGQAVMMVQMQAKNQTGAFIHKAVHLTSGLHFFEAGRLNELYREARFKVAEQQASGIITISKLVTSD